MWGRGSIHSRKLFGCCCFFNLYRISFKLFNKEPLLSYCVSCSIWVWGKEKGTSNIIRCYQKNQKIDSVVEGRCFLKKKLEQTYCFCSSSMGPIPKLEHSSIEDKRLADFLGSHCLQLYFSLDELPLRLI